MRLTHIYHIAEFQPCPTTHFCETVNTNRVGSTNIDRKIDEYTLDKVFKTLILRISGSTFGVVPRYEVENVFLLFFHSLVIPTRGKLREIAGNRLNANF